MFTINSILICAATGLGCGYESLVKNQHGRFYLAGNWRINDKNRDRKTGYLMYLGI